MHVVHIGGIKNMKVVRVPEDVVQDGAPIQYLKPCVLVSVTESRNPPPPDCSAGADTYYGVRLVFRDESKVLAGYVARLSGLSDEEFWGIVDRNASRILQRFSLVKKGPI
ncbi:hypothetical protein [Maridesulfovibrio sp.]|uniref:hypothetical protein n=1 Tax=Maridesulfovibrio sp. TaxID=2795000 RepID=UPI002AA835C0|nr:hypothetical protein [Maridesulfovibrio sp.]